MMESSLDEETEKTLLHLVASLLLVSNYVESDSLFIVDDVSVNEITTSLLVSITCV